MRTIFHARQPRAENKHSGFTIVELLIVIVVIAILAAITIAAYNGITQRAVESSLESDLRSNATALELDKTRDGSYPADGSSANGGQGLKASGNNSLTYVQKPYGYCVTATNPKTDKTYIVKSFAGQITEGTCDVVASTTAGTGTIGYLDGPAATAQFGSIGSMTIDTAGNLYLIENIEYGVYRIRKITPAGDVTTVSGSPANGGITVDTVGNLYATSHSDQGYRISKITPAGVVSTFAGSSTYGYLDGPAATAQFSNTRSITIDTAGNLYVPDSNNYRIRKITPTGVVSTFAGSGTNGYLDGPAATAQFGSMGDITVDTAGNLYMIDGHRIRKISPAGVVSTFAGSGTDGYLDGPAVTAQFSSMSGIAIDTVGNLYVADNGNFRIRKITPAGVVSTLAGDGTHGYVDGPVATAKLGYIGKIAIDTIGNLYISDGYRIRKLTQ